MHLSRIELRDWKVYREAVFEFPKPELDGSNIVLIGAPNGYGKTSLFEAVILGLFGRSGLPLIARASDGAQESADRSYRRFLEMALHSGALEDDRRSCSVRLVFVDESDLEIDVRRIWHFDDSGEYLTNDEEVSIHEGSGEQRRPIQMSSKNVLFEDRDEWFRDHIAHRFLPHNLAEFFMFDGERVSELAEKDKKEQVSFGIEGLLGIPILRQLSRDLGDYAKDRSTGTKHVSDKHIEKIGNEIDKFRAEIAQDRRKLERIEPDLQMLERARDRLLRDLADYQENATASRHEQVDRLKNHEQQYEETKSRLEKLLTSDIALAIAGRGLRNALTARLKSETLREQWEAGKSQGDGNLARFLDSMRRGVGRIEPALSIMQTDSVIAEAGRAWENLWHPPPEDCAESYRHPYLNMTDRGRVVELLNDAKVLGSYDVVELLDAIFRHEAEVRRIREEIDRSSAVTPQLDKKRDSLKRITDEIGEKKGEVKSLNRDISGRQSQLDARNQDLARLLNQRDQSKPAIRRAACATKVAAMVDDLVRRTVPSQTGAVANAMTKAHRLMAHKTGLVDRVKITEDCEVRLFNAEGRDVRDHDLSAGEKQIFTQALFAAVASVSRRDFPMIVDTPLGRLDKSHRKGVLEHFMRRGHQVILLSTDTEIVGEYRNIIGNSIQKTYRIEFEPGGGDMGVSRVVEGYFSETSP